VLTISACALLIAAGASICWEFFENTESPIPDQG
jgi:hypothetical protein